MTRSPLAAALCAALLSACGSGANVPASSCDAPGAGWIAYIDLAGSAFRLVAAEQDGSCVTTLAADPGGDISPSWATSTHRVAYLAAEQIHVHDLATGVTTIVATPGVTPGSTALSPDGTTVAFQGRVGSDPSEIYTVPVAGGTPTQVTTTATASDTGPAWSPDGQRLFFVSSRSGVNEVWSVRASDGLDPVQVTSMSSILGAPTVSPDGLKVAYARRKPDQSSQIVERVLAGGTERVLSDHKDGEPAYDASGTRLAVSTYRYTPGRADVVILDASTGALVSRVTTCSQSCGAPAFPR